MAQGNLLWDENELIDEKTGCKKSRETVHLSPLFRYRKYPSLHLINSYAVFLFSCNFSVIEEEEEEATQPPLVGTLVEGESHSPLGEADYSRIGEADYSRGEGGEADYSGQDESRGGEGGDYDVEGSGSFAQPQAGSKYSKEREREHLKSEILKHDLKVQ